MRDVHPAPLAERLKAGEHLVGLVVKMPCPAIIETGGHLGYDLVVIDTEHGGGDTLELENHVRAADSVGIETLVRVGSNDRLQILRALDAGATGVVIPHVNSVEDVAAAVAAAHYPPLGTRGFAASTRAGRHSTGSPQDHLRRSEQRTVVVAQLEDRRAVPQAAAIASAAGVNAVWLGPSDLSMSLGHPGEFSHPHVAEAIDAIVGSVNAARAAAFIALANDEAELAEWRRRGASVALFAVSTLIAGRLRDVITAARAADPADTQLARLQ